MSKSKFDLPFMFLSLKSLQRNIFFIQKQSSIERVFIKMSLLLNSFDWKVAKLNMNIIICEISLCLFKMINKGVDFEIVFTHFYSKSTIERVFVWFLCSSIEKRKMNQIFVLNLVLSECSFEFLVLLFLTVRESRTVL